MNNRKLINIAIPIIAILFLVIAVRVDNQSERHNSNNEEKDETVEVPEIDTDVEIVSEPITELRTTTLIEPTTDSERSVQEGDTITVTYKGWLASDGYVFDQSGPDGYTFTNGGGVIDGWNQGTLGMKEGEQRRLYIPYAQAYGEAGRGDIPPAADLIFDVQLVSFSN